MGRGRWHLIGWALWAVACSAWAADEWVKESPGQRAIYGPEGELRRVELDEDRDGRFEVVELYESGRRVERREDRDGNGVWEMRFEWEADGTAISVEALPGGGVRRTWYDGDGTVTRVEEDQDGDGKSDAVWEYRDGTVARATNAKGTWTYEGGVLQRAEVDADGDGRAERVEVYEDGKIARVEERPGGDGIRSLWFFRPDGQPDHVEEDQDGDGRREATRTFEQDGRIERTVDGDGDGKPELLEVYSADGELLSRREDLDGDGVYDLREGRVSGGD